jgi:hypothetical protein
MRTVAIIIHNGDSLEIFVKRLKFGFEVWKVGPIKGRRVILDHHLTHDDLEAKLYYSKHGDLAWRNAKRHELPIETHPSVAQAESVDGSSFIDFETSLGQPLVHHLSSIANLIPVNRKVFNVAKGLMIGRWTDGTATVSLKSEARLALSLSVNRSHPLNLGQQIHGYRPDRWNFKGWQLFLLSKEHDAGLRIGVIHIDGNELHIWASGSRHKIANVFYRL